MHGRRFSNWQLLKPRRPDMSCWKLFATYNAGAQRPQRSCCPATDLASEHRPVVNCHSGIGIRPAAAAVAATLDSKPWPPAPPPPSSSESSDSAPLFSSPRGGGGAVGDSAPPATAAEALASGCGLPCSVRSSRSRPSFVPYARPPPCNKAQKLEGNCWTGCRASLQAISLQLWHSYSWTCIGLMQVPLQRTMRSGRGCEAFTESRRSTTQPDVLCLQSLHHLAHRMRTGRGWKAAALTSSSADGKTRSSSMAGETRTTSRTVCTGTMDCPSLARLRSSARCRLRVICNSH